MHNEPLVDNRRFLFVMKCSCTKQRDVQKLGEYPPGFLWRPKKLDSKVGGEVVLFRCADCGASWQIDRWARDGVNLCVRVDDPDNWQTFDDKPLRYRYLEQNRGGKSTERCRWQCCDKYAVKGLAFCAECAFEKMGVLE